GDRRAVLAAELLLRAHHDGGHDLALLDRALRAGLLDGGHDRVSHTRIAPPRAAADADAEDHARAGVVGHAQTCLVLDHRARSRTSTSRQRLERESGRDSMTLTVSPMCASLRSSCACSVDEVRTIFS